VPKENSSNQPSLDTCELQFLSEVEKFRGYSTTARSASRNPMFLFLVFSKLGGVDQYKQANIEGGLAYSLWINWLAYITQLDEWKVKFHLRLASDSTVMNIGVKKAHGNFVELCNGPFLEWGTRSARASYFELEQIHPKFLNRDVGPLWLLNALYNSSIDSPTSFTGLADYCLFWSLAGMRAEHVVDSVRNVAPNFDESMRIEAISRALDHMAANFIFRCWYQGVDPELLPFAYSKGLTWVEKVKDSISIGSFYYSGNERSRMNQVVPPEIRRMSYSQLRRGYHGGYRMPPLTIKMPTY